MNVRDLSLGSALGFLAGTIVTGSVLYRPLRDIVRSDAKFKARQKAMFEHLVNTMGPYCPKEVLQQNLEYIQFDSIVTTYEEPC